MNWQAYVLGTMAIAAAFACWGVAVNAGSTRALLLHAIDRLRMTYTRERILRDCLEDIREALEEERPSMRVRIRTSYQKCHMDLASVDLCRKAPLTVTEGVTRMLAAVTLNRRREPLNTAPKEPT